LVEGGDKMSELKKLPPNVELETKKVLKQLARSHRFLAELKGYVDLLPNKNKLVNAVTINEAKDSSEIENIVTTHDELYKTLALSNQGDPAAKEVANYRKALLHGYELLNQKEFLSTNIFIEIHKIIEKNNSGLRKVPGTKIINQATDEIVHEPPETYQEIIDLLSNLENYINTESDKVDNLIKLAVIHYQFEAIHPFYDGNGRTGRIINLLYLILKDLLDSPILYLSRYIIANKQQYYNLLRQVTDDNSWEDWVLYILKAIEETSKSTLKLAQDINELVDASANVFQERNSSIYSQELIEIIFNEPYTKIEDVQNGLDVTRKTASNYLSSLEKINLMRSEKIGRQKLYINKPLMNLLKKAGDIKY